MQSFAVFIKFTCLRKRNLFYLLCVCGYEGRGLGFLSPCPVEIHARKYSQWSHYKKIRKKWKFNSSLWGHLCPLEYPRVSTPGSLSLEDFDLSSVVSTISSRLQSFVCVRRFWEERHFFHILLPFQIMHPFSKFHFPNVKPLSSFQRFSLSVFTRYL